MIEMVRLAISSSLLRLEWRTCQYKIVCLNPAAFKPNYYHRSILNCERIFCYKMIIFCSFTVHKKSAKMTCRNICADFHQQILRPLGEQNLAENICYKSQSNSLADIETYRTYPKDQSLTEISVGWMQGQLGRFAKKRIFQMIATEQKITVMENLTF